jgi:hypothetical protein
MQAASPAVLELTKRLRWLRVAKWPDVRLTQSDLAKALGEENALSAATIASWENLVSPKLPPDARLRAYARFFATRRSVESAPRLLPLDSLADDERAAYAQLEAELLGLRAAAVNPPEPNKAAARSWHFQDGGPVTLICAKHPDDGPALPVERQDPNYTELVSFADLDALIELHGHIRAENPDMRVSFKTADRVVADDLSGHIVILGGVLWDEITGRLTEMTQLPIRQDSHPSIKSGEAFIAKSGDDDMRFLPKWKDDSQTELIEDVGLFARAPNPLNITRSLTICKGTYSRGTLGAVRSLTDARVRRSNEQYILDSFGDSDRFAIIMSVPVISGKAMSPDLHAPTGVLYQWSSATGWPTKRGSPDVHVRPAQTDRLRGPHAIGQALNAPPVQRRLRALPGASVGVAALLGGHRRGRLAVGDPERQPAAVVVGRHRHPLPRP